MTADITIPKEAIEAHAKALLTHETWGLRSWSDLSDAEREERLEGSEVACLAMLKAWPGIIREPEDAPDGVVIPPMQFPYIILPLAAGAGSMTDIAEKLRDYANDDHERLCQGRTYSCSCGYDDKRDPLMTEAADTITALRAENERLKEIGNQSEAMALGYATENERLREFVLFVDKWTNYKPNKPEKPTSYEDCVKTIAPMAREFARAALEPSNE